LAGPSKLKRPEPQAFLIEEDFLKELRQERKKGFLKACPLFLKIQKNSVPVFTLLLIRKKPIKIQRPF